MGVLNVTPDSFSDGGRFYVDQQLHMQHLLAIAGEMISAGAGILDVGGESTRPGAQPVGIPEELSRVIPVVRALAELPAVISVDTRHATVAAEAIAAGAHVINDVSAGADPQMLPLIAESDVGFALMHMQGIPGNMQQAPRYQQVVEEVYEFLQSRIAACDAVGIAPQRLLVDPGFGFGKTVDHNLQLLAQLERFTTLGCPLLVGLSRKSMLAKITGRDVAERVHGSVAAAQLAVQHGADIVRVHDVAATRDMLSVLAAVDAANDAANDTAADVVNDAAVEGMVDGSVDNAAAANKERE